MKFYKIDPSVDVVETPVEERGRLIRHLHLAKGKEIPEHKVNFTALGETVQMLPGTFLTMEPNELHSLYGVEESHVLVIQQLIY